MVDYKNAFATEKKIFELLRQNKKLAKYKLQLHVEDQYGIDVQATAPGYEDFAIEIESTQGSKWPAGAPYPTTWKKFSVPTRKKKFFDRHPMSLFVKVNQGFTDAVVIPMAYVCSFDRESYANQTDGHFDNNEFFVTYDPEHPALCFCTIEDLAAVIDEHFKHMAQLKRVNAKFTVTRPKFGLKPSMKELKHA